MSATSIVTPEGIECGGFMFYNNFDSANLAKVELVESNDSSSENGKIICVTVKLREATSKRFCLFLFFISQANHRHKSHLHRLPKIPVLLTWSSTCGPSTIVMERSFKTTTGLGSISESKLQVQDSSSSLTSST